MYCKHCGEKNPDNVLTDVLHHLVVVVVVEQTLHGLDITGILGIEGIHVVVSCPIVVIGDLVGVGQQNEDKPKYPMQRG